MIFRKLTSRKFWLSVGAIAAALAVPGVPPAFRVIAVAVSGAAYSIAEALVDRAKTTGWHQLASVKEAGKTQVRVANGPAPAPPPVAVAP